MSDPAVELYRDVLLAFTALLAALIFLSGLDDAFIDACYWIGSVWRRRRALRGAAASALLAKPQSPFAIAVPAWKEHDVIAAMIENTLGTVDYRAYRIFCGVYPNDPATGAEVDRMARRYPGLVVRVDVGHDGPTCKADCLNHIVRRVLEEEAAAGRRFAGIVLHDSEDVIHPLELKLFNALLPGHALVQLPVFSLGREWSDLTAGTYMDDFAESHGKDMAVREALTGVVPGAGVATCYSRAALSALWAYSAGKPFNTASLTEDYDLSFRLRSMGLRQTFAHVRVEDPESRPPRVHGPTAEVVSTHEYFPDRIRAAYRQRARWVIGIAFQGWQHLRWRGSLLERYFFFRDRKAVIMAPAGVLAYLLLLNYALAVALGSPAMHASVDWILSLPALHVALAANLLFMVNRALQRMFFVGRYYGPPQALLSLLRMPVNNLINFLAVMRAWRLFLAHLATGRKLAWDKTAHVFPERIGAAPAKALGMAALFCVLFGLGHAPAIAAPPLEGPAYELADKAYKAVERGDLEWAMTLASQALKLAPGHPSLLMLEADILAQQGKSAQALELLRPLGREDLGGPGLAQRGYLWPKQDAAAAEADFAAALDAGGLEPQQRSNVLSELAQLARARNDDAAAAKWLEMALSSAPPGSRGGIASELGYIALRRKDDAAAEKWFRMALGSGSLSPASRGDIASELAYLALRRNDDAAAVEWFKAALESGAPQSREDIASELAYLALRHHDDATALKWFQTALAAPPAGAKRGQLYSDAGYAALRLGKNRLAADLLARSVDEWHAAPPGDKPFDEEALYGTRRSIDTLRRGWSGTLSVGHGMQGFTGTGPIPGALRVVQAGAELAYTPEFGYRNERLFQLYADAFQSLSASEGDFPTGPQSRVAGLGARYKPFEKLDLSFGLERRFALGDQAGEDDWLLRVAWGASHNTDWSPTKDSWTTWELYTESAYFTRARVLIQPFQARIGRSFKLPQWYGAVLMPYVGIGGAYDETQTPHMAAGVGPGVALRYWFGESRYRAFPKYLDFSLQYRVRVTDARRGGGFFGQVSLSF